MESISENFINAYENQAQHFFAEMQQAKWFDTWWIQSVNFHCRIPKCATQVNYNICHWANLLADFCQDQHSHFKRFEPKTMKSFWALPSSQDQAKAVERTGPCSYKILSKIAWKWECHSLYCSCKFSGGHIFIKYYIVLFHLNHRENFKLSPTDVDITRLSAGAERTQPYSLTCTKRHRAPDSGGERPQKNGWTDCKEPGGIVDPDYVHSISPSEKGIFWARRSHSVGRGLRGRRWAEEEPGRILCSSTSTER